MTSPKARDPYDPQVRTLTAPLVMLDCGPPNTPKMLIETLAIAQARIGSSKLDKHRKEADIARLQWLIDQIRGGGR